jgi:hypothetical protein
MHLESVLEIVILAKKSMGIIGLTIVSLTIRVTDKPCCIRSIMQESQRCEILGTSVRACVHIFGPPPLFARIRFAAIQVRPVCLHIVRILLTSNENANHSQLQD